MAVTASFAYCITSGSTDDPSGYTIEITDTSTGGADKWNYSFGDGYTSKDQNPTHTYTEAGPHTVTLIAYEADGSTTVVNDSFIERRWKGGSGSSNTAAFADFNAASWIIDTNSSQARYTLGRVAFSFSYFAIERTQSFDLTAFNAATNVAYLQIFFNNVVNVPDSIVKQETLDFLIASGTTGVWTFLGDVDSFLGTDTLSFKTVDGSSPAYPKLTAPIIGNSSGWATDLRIIIQPIASKDTTSQVIESITADFLANGSALPVVGTNIFNVSLTDQTNKTPNSWSYYKRKANTEIIVTPANPEQVNAPGTLPNSIFTQHPNVNALVVKDTTQTTTYVLGVDYSITLPSATGEIVILDAGITPGELLKLEYTSVNPWTLISTDQDPNIQFDKENP